MYSQPATTLTPALIIYLIDASDSMNERCEDTTRIELVNKALRAGVKDMVRRSMRDGVVQRRYKLAIFAYSTKVIDVLGGIRDLPELLRTGVPELSAGGVTDTAGGFEKVESLLESHLKEFEYSPAPLVCHLTDGVFTTTDPSPSMTRIQEMHVVDGTVLVENVYFKDDMLRRHVGNWEEWPGVMRASELTDDYARFLFDLSSPLPETYRQNINNYGYHIEHGASLFFPGVSSDLVRLAFAISSATLLK
jgi:uncharacterized protein YegL